MWLLDTTSLTLVYFIAPPAEYAILSHTWEDDEVTFKEWRTTDVSSRKGYQKISAFCALAARDGYAYGWVDTCCIDKDSSAELSEAINSMYKWYEKSSLCYAFLSDRNFFGQDIHENHLLFSMWFMPRILCSRWWSRGWTLQELIAPKFVGFFDSDWKFLGTKLQFAGEISRKTGIDKDILTKKRGLDSATTAQKMTWVSTRETTREEDMAYCLLGLFGVNMPLLYGEGTNAFQRLQEAILAVTDDESILAWADPDSDAALSGPLAPHPRAFRSSQDLLRYFESPDSDVSDWKMTNRGLHLKLPILACPSGHPLHDTGIVLGLLNCSRSGEYSGPAAIHLRKVGHATYIRASYQEMESAGAIVEKGSGYEIVPYSLAKHAVSQVIFIRKKNTAEHVQAKRECAYHITGDWREHGIRLDHVWPPEHWDQARMIVRKPCVAAVLLFVIENVNPDKSLRNSQGSSEQTVPAIVTASTAAPTQFAVIIRPSGCGVLSQEEIPMTRNPTAQDRTAFLQFKHEMQCHVASTAFSSPNAVRLAQRYDEDPYLGEGQVPVQVPNYELLVRSHALRPITAELSPSSCEKQVRGDLNVEVHLRPDTILGATMLVVDIRVSGPASWMQPSPLLPLLSHTRSAAASEAWQLYDRSANQISQRRTREEENNVPGQVFHELA